MGKEVASMPPGQTKSPRINCMKCEHFYITWDKNYPRGCRSYGFKTQQLPSLVVYQSSGLPCMHYAEKKT
jgi:hypothetical protein